jgi:hypothetical protein
MYVPLAWAFIRTCIVYLGVYSYQSRNCCLSQPWWIGLKRGDPFGVSKRDTDFVKRYSEGLHN